MNILSIDHILTDLAELNCPEELKQRIMKGAITCVQRWGIERTGLNDIAREAGCARQTVYNYFKNRDAVILAALMESAAEFSDKLIAHIETFSTLDDKLIEAMMFSLEHVPNEPYLKLVTDAKFSPLFNQEMFDSQLCLGTLTRIVRQCISDDPKLIEQASEMGEVMTRFFLSLLLIKGPKKRTGDEMRAFLRRRLLPGLIITGL